MARFSGWIETPYINSRYKFEFTVDDEDLEDLSGFDRDRVIEEVFADERDRYLSSSWTEA